MVGAPLKAAAGRAMAVKLQTKLMAECLRVTSLVIDVGFHFSTGMSRLLFGPALPGDSFLITFKEKGKASWIVPRRRGVRGARTAISLAPSPQRVLPRGNPEEVAG